MLAGLLAAAATGFAFRVFPVDLSSPVSWLWVPLFGGMVFVNAFGLAAITLLVPWEVVTHYVSKAGNLQVIEGGSTVDTSGEVSATGPAIARESVA